MIVHGLMAYVLKMLGPHSMKYTFWISAAAKRSSLITVRKGHARVCCVYVGVFTHMGLQGDGRLHAGLVLSQDGKGAVGKLGLDEHVRVRLPVIRPAAVQSGRPLLPATMARSEHPLYEVHVRH